MSDTKDKISKQNKDRCEVAYDFNHFKFSNNETNTFRASITTVSDGVTLWLENKGSKNQWQGTFQSIAECGPADVPEDAVVAFLKEAFEGLQSENYHLEDGKDEPELDLKMAEGKAVLTLTISMRGIWKPQFVFSLLPVGLDKIDILEAKLRDAQEEIQHLKEGSKVAYFSVCSVTTCQPNQFVAWDSASSNEICDTHFCFSEDKKSVTILKEGVYKLNVRLTGSDPYGSALFNVQLNNAIINNCFNSNEQGYLMSATASQILRLKEGDVLNIQWTASNGSDVTAATNTFSLLLLGH